MSSQKKYFNLLFWFIAAVAFFIICLRAFFIPFTHDETATFFFYIQNNDYLPYLSHVYTNNHFLNSALSNIFFHLAGSHRFILRLPNILAFLILCIGIYRHFRHLQNTSSKFLLIAFLLLSFNFLDFFALCRGYGISMAFLALGMSYLVDYFIFRKAKSLLLFSLFLQLALAANLILVVVFTILLALIYLFQLREKLFFKLPNILLQVFNLSLLFFWIKLSFFYKNEGKLDYGVGDSYTDVTFKSLIQYLFETKDTWILICAVIMFGIIVIGSLHFLLRNGFRLKHVYSPALLYSTLLSICIISFYLQKKILNVNYPEDRTGLFFFVFFVFALAFIIDSYKIASLVITTLIIAGNLFYFTSRFNVTHFASYVYHTIPKENYDILVNELNTSKQAFTIGGHRVREMDFAFLNYRGQSVLNPMDNSEEMQMNCDYYIAMACEKPYYDKFYTEMAYDKIWDRVLLKRKEAITRNYFAGLSEKKEFNGSNEFFEIKRIKDTTFASENPLELEAEITFGKVDAPLNAWLVFEIQNEKGEQIWYKRILFNWLADDLNGKTRFLKLTTGNLPKKTTAVAYIWNIDKKEMKIKLNNFKLSQLSGKGVNFRVPAQFYTTTYAKFKKPLL